MIPRFNGYAKQIFHHLSENVGKIECKNDHFELPIIKAATNYTSIGPERK